MTDTTCTHCGDAVTEYPSAAHARQRHGAHAFHLLAECRGTFYCRTCAIHFTVKETP